MGTKPGPLILVVDDDCDTCGLLALVLELVGGFRTEIAFDRTTALLLLEAVEPPALAVVDWHLGRSNGDELAQEVAERCIPSFLITAANCVDRSVKTEVVLFKPFDSHLFVDVVAGMLDHLDVALPRCRELQSRGCLDSTTSTKSPTGH